MKQLPLRVRLTLPFALAMALVLAALSAFIYLRVGSELLHSTDAALATRAVDALGHVQRSQPLLGDDTTDRRADIAEVVSAAGAVRQSTSARLPPLIDGGRLARVTAGHELRFTRPIPGLEGNWRLLAVPVQARGAPAALVLGRSLGAHDETLEHLRDVLLLAGPAALLLAIAAGYWVAGAALRPVEEMRRRAAALSHETPGGRLPVPPARDELSRLAETLNEMLERLEAAFAHERRFVADASHELRTPLALLRTELELALRRPRTHDELEATVRSAAEETERLSKLASDLLLIARSDQGPLPLRREAVSGRELLAATERRFTTRATELGRTVAVEPGDDEELSADRERVEQALGNLVENALVHGAGTVELSLRRNDGEVELHVRDEGPGFPLAFAPRAFDRFSRADEARGHGGSGLGLAIVAAIAEAHGGAARVAANGHADVWLTLPATSGSGRRAP